MHQLLARCAYPEMPVPMGVIRQVTTPTYGDYLDSQIEVAKFKNHQDVAQPPPRPLDLAGRVARAGQYIASYGLSFPRLPRESRRFPALLPEPTYIGRRGQWSI